VAAALVRARLETDGQPALRRIAKAAALDARPIEELAAAHARSRARLDDELSARAELWFANYCRNYFIQDWYLQSPSLMEHVMRLLVRVAMVRALLFAQPGLDRALLALDRAAACDAVAVDVFYSVARAFDHNEGIRAQLGSALAEHKLSTLAHAIAFLKF
jgi:hypothetical protein